MRLSCIALSLGITATPVLAQFRGKTNVHPAGDKAGRVVISPSGSSNSAAKGSALTLISPVLSPLGTHSNEIKPSAETAATLGLPVSVIGGLEVKTPSRPDAPEAGIEKAMSDVSGNVPGGSAGASKDESTRREDPEHFVIVLHNLAIPSAVTAKVGAYMVEATRGAGDREAARRNRFGVASLAAAMGERLLGKDLSAEELTVLILAAVMRDGDPSGAKAAEIFGDFSRHMGMSSEILARAVAAIIDETRSRSEAESLDQMEKDYRDVMARQSARPAAKKKLNAMADLLAYSDRVEPYVFGNPSEIGKADPSLKNDSNFALIPLGLKSRFTATLEKLEKDGPIAPASLKNSLTRNRGSPEDLLENAAALAQSVSGNTPAERVSDADRARSYVHSIAGSMKLRPDQFDALVQDFMQERGIDPDSSRGRALIGELNPSKASADAKSLSNIDPRFNHFSSLILKLSREYAVTPAHVESLIKTSGLSGFMSGMKNKDQLERALDNLLSRDQLETFIAAYPKNRQGDLMRGVVSDILTPSGKSIEEVSRDGVFVYVDFVGRQITRSSSGRNPDDPTHSMTFYVRFTGQAWRIDGQRQRKTRGFSGGSDSEMIETLQDWLIAGGVPAAHFLNRR